MSVRLTVDRVAQAAYARLSDDAVERSVDLGDVVVDLDGMGLVVGIEMLDLDAEIPFRALVEEYHVHSGVVDTLRLLRPSVNSFLALTVSAEGTSAPVPSAHTAPR